MTWKATTQADLIEILYYPYNQYSIDRFSIKMNAIENLVPQSLAQASIDRIELLVTQFRASDTAVSGGAIGSSSDGRILAKADVLEWATNDRLIKHQSQQLNNWRDEIRERIRIALDMTVGSMAPLSLVASSRRVRS